METRVWPWWAFAGFGLFGLGFWMVAEDIPAWNTVWYVPAWYGYLLVLDAVIYRFQGHSFLRGRLREAGAMCFWSAPFWYLYEAYNLVLKNWYYVFGLHSDLAAGCFGFVAFTTVFPACFFHAECFKALGWWETVRWPRLRVTPTLRGFLWVWGALCCVLPLVLPRYAFWMVWGATLGIPELLNYRWGAPSILKDLEDGRPGRLTRLLAGGACAGLLWEGLNYWARCKWIYTVPGLEDWKLFEMPLLGFLGFPVLAVNAFSAYALLCHCVRGGRHWELVELRLKRTEPGLWYAVAIGVALALCFFSIRAGLSDTLHSRRPLLEELHGLNRNAISNLKAGGVSTPELLVRAVKDRGLLGVGEQAGLDAGDLEPVYHQAVLSLHKGMGTEAAALLMRTGVRDVRDLVSIDAEDLYSRMRALAPSDVKQFPTRAEVSVWVRAAQFWGRVSR
ncbi:MAG: DUF4332 domain-containing protein [bacterium]|nr:DUF4332 domain-containing protein [bacterium]